MDGGEGGMGSREEHRISIPDQNAGGSGASVDPGITEEVVSSLPSDPPNMDEEWIREVEYKIASAFEVSIHWPLLFANEETEPKIRKLSLHNRISRPKLETEEGLSQPSVVAIGPFHRGRDEVSISDNDKRVIVGLMNLLYGLDSASCLVKIKKKVANARRCYYKFDISQSSGFQDDKSFAEMLLLDSYFILFMLTIQIRKELTHYTLMPLIPNIFSELPVTGRFGGLDRDKLRLYQHGPFQCVNILFNKDEIVPDLLILDNQIPFFVIEKLFKELKSENPLHKYALEFFETIHPWSARLCIHENRHPSKILHLLDLFHWSRVPRNKYDKFRWSDPELDSIVWSPYTPNAMELRESATVFKKKTFGSSLDITFRRRRFTPTIRVLDIPEFHIRNYSSLIFHNLIAFEIQSSKRGRCSMAFSALMRNLLQSEEDVKLLRQRGILVSSSMTDSQLVDLFARLSKLTENHEMPSDLFAICHQVQSYHNFTVSRFFRFVILGYFPNPQATFFVFVAALLFVPTILQTIYAIIYHN